MRTNISFASHGGVIDLGKSSTSYWTAHCIKKSDSGKEQMKSKNLYSNIRFLSVYGKWCTSRMSIVQILSITLIRSFVFIEHISVNWKFSECYTFLYAIVINVIQFKTKSSTVAIKSNVVAKSKTNTSYYYYKKFYSLLYTTVQQGWCLSLIHI